MIKFEFEGKNYAVATEAYELDRMKLPDGRVLVPINGWSERNPPTPLAGVKLAEDQSSYAPLAEEVE